MNYLNFFYKKLQIYAAAIQESNDENIHLLNLVQEQLDVLSKYWFMALKDFAYLSIPNGESFLNSN